MSFSDADFDTARGPMLFTEDEARQRWCPFARVAFIGGVGANRVSSLQQKAAERQAEQGDDRDLKYFAEQRRDTNCMASGCMAWRLYQVWLPSVHEQGTTGAAPESRTYGYCGLATKVG